MSLPRVLEPEVMDSLEEATDYDTMDHSAVNEAFVNDLLDAWEGIEPAEDVLDLGTGTAQIPIALCSRAEHCRVMAVDLATHMLDAARYNVEAAGLIERILLNHVDAKQLPFADEMFDAVISNSIVHHIARPNDVLQEAWRVTRAGGLIFFRDLLRPESDSEVARLVKLYAGDENGHQQKMFDDSLRAALTLDEIRELVAELNGRPDEVRATTDRHWTWITRRDEPEASGDGNSDD